MKFIKPNFYDAFHCTAAACSDTCCAGWEIDVDPDTVEYYENLEGELGDRLREELCDLPDGTVCFRLGENERCPFLDDDNLCELILKLGDDALCEICREHPRFYELCLDIACDACIGQAEHLFGWPAKISIDGGKTYCTISQALAAYSLDQLKKNMVWNLRKDLRKYVQEELPDNCTDAQFLMRYLELAPVDLIIG